MPSSNILVRKDSTYQIDGVRRIQWVISSPPDHVVTADGGLSNLVLTLIVDRLLPCCGCVGIGQKAGDAIQWKWS